jgi:DNA-binding GntR family transcriptional regulator
MHAGRFERLDNQTLRGKLVDMIRRAILSNDYPPGTLINQAEIAKQLDISRAPLREALSQLQEEGLVRIVPYKGAYVADLTEKDIEEIYSLRSTLETFAVRRATEAA